MAKNKAKMNKFLTGAITASLVATAVAPVASAASFTDLDRVDNSVKAEIDKAVELGFFIDADKFNPAGTINRSQAALTLARYIAGGTANTAALKAYVEANDLETVGVAPFEDVPVSYKNGNAHQEELFYAALIVKDAGAFTQDNLNPTGPVTRSQMAKIITGAFGLNKAADYQSDITDINHLDAETKGFIETIASHGVTNVTTFNPAGTVTRSQMASFLVRSYDVVNAEATVLSVSATDAKTLVVTGTALNKLSAEDITIEDNSVAAVNFATGGKSATVTLDTPLVDGQEYKVSVKVGEETKEFTVKFTFVLADVAITTTTLEANKDKQFLQVTLNGSVTDLATIDSLGYDIEFQADEAVFATDTPGTAVTTSTTGEIDETVAATELNETFNVKAVLTKDGKTAESKTVEVEVVSKATPAIGDIGIKTDELALTKAVVSTKDNVVEVSGVTSNTGDKIDVSGLSSFASSNPEVATINASTGAITPIKAGKTTITVKAGNVVYSKEITVVNEERVATKAAAKAVNVAPGSTSTVNVIVTDQFGENLDSSAIVATGGSETVAVSEVTGEVNVSAADATVDGVLPVTVAPAIDATAGSYTIVVKDLTTLKNLGQFTVKVSADNTADNYKLEVADFSKGVANLAGTKTVTLNAKEFTKSGGFLRTLDSADTDATDFTVESANPTIATVDAAPDADGKIVVTGVKVGTTQIILKKEGVQVATATIKVEEVVPTIESISWKADKSTITVAGKEVTYKDIFNITETAAGIDEIVEGVKLNVDTTSKVRIDYSTPATPFLYLDSDDNGSHDDGEEILGNIKVQLAGSAGETITLGSDWTDNILGQETASGDKGTLVITVTDDDTNTTVRASSTLNVDVK